MGRKAEDSLFDQLLASSKEAIHEKIEGMRKSLKEYEAIAPLLYQFTALDCKMLRFRYDEHIKNGFTPEQALELVIRK
jgi:hypothetical protein